jgi:hypothetical protein
MSLLLVLNNYKILGLFSKNYQINFIQTIDLIVGVMAK